MLKNQVAIGVDGFITYSIENGWKGKDWFVEPIKVNDSGVINPGYAVDQVRLCTEFSEKKQILLQHLVDLHEAAEAVDWGTVRFAAERPEDTTRVLRPSVWHSPVYRAVTKQLFAPEERGELAYEIEGLADTGSSVIDFDVTHLSRDERLLRWNLLNALAPLAMASAHRQFCLGKPGCHKSWRYCA